MRGHPVQGPSRPFRDLPVAKPSSFLIVANGKPSRDFSIPKVGFSHDYLSDY